VESISVALPCYAQLLDDGVQRLAASALNGEQDAVGHTCDDIALLMSRAVGYTVTGRAGRGEESGAMPVDQDFRGAQLTFGMEVDRFSVGGERIAGKQLIVMVDHHHRRATVDSSVDPLR